MGGMALGAWLGGRLAAGREHPLVLYALCEIGIGVYCAATSLVFGGIQVAYVHLAAGIAPDAPTLTALRVGLGMAGLMLPTVLMGMTLPILARYLEQRSYALGRSVAVLYAANTAGAALGALLVGYAVIQAFGIRGTTMSAVFVNFLVAFLAMRLHKRGAGRPADGPVHVSLAEASTRLPTPGAEQRSVVFSGYTALAILGVGGAITLALETIYIHLLAVVAGNSTYAFSLMLFTFLLGLGAGAEVARRLLQRHAVPLAKLLGWLECALAIVILGGVFMWDAMPAYFASFENYPLARGFAAREVVRGIVCWLAMFPPAFFIGAIYPLAMECIGRAHPRRAIHALGGAAALNTIGNIVGVLAGGFVLLPLLGALASVHALALGAIVLGALALAISPQAKRWTTWMPAVAGLVLFALQPLSFDYDRLGSGANVYFAKLNFGKVIAHHADDEMLSTRGPKSSRHTIPREPGPAAAAHAGLYETGKFQGNDALGGEMQGRQFGHLAFALTVASYEPPLSVRSDIGYGNPAYS
jgi:predicted membrane-bound spermidine synthase